MLKVSTWLYTLFAFHFFPQDTRNLIGALSFPPPIADHQVLGILRFSAERTANKQPKNGTWYHWKVSGLRHSPTAFERSLLACHIKPREHILRLATTEYWTLADRFHQTRWTLSKSTKASDVETVSRLLLLRLSSLLHSRSQESQL